MADPATTETRNIATETALKDRQAAHAGSDVAKRLMTETATKTVTREATKTVQEHGRGVNDEQRDRYLDRVPAPANVPDTDVSARAAADGISEDEARTRIEDETGVTTARGRREAFSQSLDVASQYVTEGFAALPDDVKNTILPEASTRLGGFGALQEMLNGLPDDAAREQLMNRVLQSEDIRLEANRIVHEVLNTDINAAVEGRIKDATVRAYMDANPGVTDVDARNQLRGQYRVEEQNRLNRRLANVVSEAATSYFQKNYDVADQLTEGAHKRTFEAELAKAQKEQTDQQKAERLQRAENVKRRLREHLNNPRSGTDSVEADFQSIVAGAGVEGLLTNLMPGVDLATDLDAQAILNDPEIRAKYEEEAFQLVTAKRLRQRKMGRGDYERLFDTLGPEKVEQYMKGLQTYRQGLRRAEEQGVISRGFLRELGRLPRNQFAMAMMLILGIGALPLGVALAGVSIPALGASVIAGGVGAGIGTARADRARSPY